MGNLMHFKNVWVLFFFFKLGKEEVFLIIKYVYF